MPTIDIDPLLRGVSKPARYIGGEWNVIERDWNERPVRWALIYPDLYDIGQSNGGLAILYDILNHTPDTLAERCYTPWPDMADSLRAHGQPLFSLETRRSLRDFDALGFSLSYELTYTNILEMLDLSGIPIRSLDRAEDDPIILAGGSGALVPEPLAPFIDAFVLGEAEDVVLEINTLLREAKTQGASRLDLLRALARTPGVYVPRFYEWRYEPDGTPAEVFATDDVGLSPRRSNASSRDSRRS